MAGPAVFDTHARRYEEWFETHPHAFSSELAALRRHAMPGRKIEIGIGTGRFALPLGIRLGIEPSAAMAAIAVARGLRVIRGIAENPPLKDLSMDTILMVTTLCFLDDPLRAFRECRRVLTDAGRLVVGFVNRESALGNRYSAGKQKSVFYRHATFYSLEGLTDLLSRAGFGRFHLTGTLTGDPDRMTGPDTVHDGPGAGGFLVLSAGKGGENG